MIEPEKVQKAKLDALKRETLIAQQTDWIRACASRAAGRWVDRHDDLYSEALIAFNDAITAYDPQKGAFSAFAAQVITNRIVDLLRRDQRHAHVLPFSALEAQGAHGETIPFEPVDAGTDGMELSVEILSLKRELAEFDISFFDLPAASPKAAKTKQICMSVIRRIGEDPQLLMQLYKTRKLPGKQLLADLRISNKVLERHRKYIIAGVLICTGDYHAVASWLMGGKGK